MYRANKFLGLRLAIGLNSSRIDDCLATLKDVVAYYNRGATPNDHLDEEIFPLNLSEEQQAALVTFLEEGLSSDDYPLVEPPKLP